MAQNIAENIKTSADKNKMSESSSTISAVNKAVSCDEEKPPNIDKELTLISGETTDTTPEENVENIVSLEIKQQQNTCKTDCNGDPEGETNLEKEVSEETETKTKENNESCSMEAKSNGKEDTELNLSQDQKLNKFLQENLLQSSNTSVSAADDAEDSSEKDNEMNETVTKKETDPKNDMTDSTKEFTASMTVKSTEEKRDSSDSSKKTEEKSEVGIVGPPTAVSEIINEEELGGDSALSADQKDHVAEWVENWVNPEEEDNIAKGCKREMYEEKNAADERARRRKQDVPSISPRKSQKIICNIIKKSIKCLNKMHAMEGAIESKKKVSTAEDNKPPKTTSPSSSKVPQNQQNGAALPEETAAASTTAVDRVRTKKEPVKDEVQEDVEMSDTKSKQLLVAGTSRQKDSSISNAIAKGFKKLFEEEMKKRKASEVTLSALGTRRKKICVEDEREKYISEVIGDDNKTLPELITKANQLQNDMKNLGILAREKEMEWNNILRKLKLKEEAYIRLNRKIDMKNYMENDSQLPTLPSGKSSLIDCNSGNTTPLSREKSFGSKDDLSEEKSSDSVAPKREKTAKTISQQRTTSPKTNEESSHKQNEASSPDCRQIGEGRQGAIVDVRSIIADHRLRHPEAVPRRGRRMRNSVNIGLGAGGAMVETGHNTDSSSTESCKSNPNASDMNSYQEILMQFAKLSQQGEPVKIPQNYPDVTLHPVAPSTAGQNSASQQSGSLLHGILTKTQSQSQSQSQPRSNTFSPTLARLLTAPERERNSPVTAAAAVAAVTAASMSQQNATAQHHLQTYQGSNMVSINDLLSSSKARTEITITPVVNTSAQSHSNDLIQVEDADEEPTMIDERKGNLACGRESKQMVKDNPPSPSAPLKCQGCMIRSAQFVCAGCGNQWYCSRTCQLAAWTIHSDYCPSESENSKVKSNV